MANKNEKTIEGLREMKITELRKEAKRLGLKNYLKSSEEDLIERILEMYELEDDDIDESIEVEVESTFEDEQAEEKEDAQVEDNEEQSEEVEKASQDEAPESEVEEKLKKTSKAKKSEKSKEKSKAKSPSKNKSGEKKSSSDKSLVSRGDSKSDRVRAIVRELEEKGRKYTSGNVILLLKERHDEEIHRSFCSSLIRQEKKRIAEEG